MSQIKWLIKESQIEFAYASLGAITEIKEKCYSIIISFFYYNTFCTKTYTITD